MKLTLAKLFHTISLYLRTMNSNSVLQKYFGFEDFRPLQKEIIEAVVRGRDTLVLMPTGGGKSVCYQVPALLRSGLTVVVSPLIALMKDQVDALRLNGVEAAFLNSSQSTDEQKEIMNQITEGVIRILYVAPERLFGFNNFYHFLKKANVTLFAIDEAHCISHWGHDFRPDYLALSSIKDEFQNVPIIALTATADKLTRHDIISKLRLSNPETFISSFNRANIRYIIEDKNDHFERVLEVLQENKGNTGIIYCLSRAETEALAEKLVKKGYTAAAYHAGLDSSLRTKRQEQFKRDEIKIIVATIAFGMGIDKSNVRFVIHTSVPKNIESYYQETGRAGRDGLPSTALLFFSNKDISRLKTMIRAGEINDQTEVMLKKLRQIGEFCQSSQCRRKYLLNYFDEEFNSPCNNCDVCLAKAAVDYFDATLIAQKALSAVKRLKERFGAVYVINFLKGSSSVKIFDEHKYLPTYGKGNEFTTDEWKYYFNQLIEQHYLTRSDEFGNLRLTDKANGVLYKDEKVLLVRPKEKKIDRKERKERYAGQQTQLKYDHVLLEKLKALRQLIADSENVAAYLVFNDNTLIELAYYLPQVMDDLRHITGFGKIKIDKYGKEFLDEVKRHCDENKLQSRIQEKVRVKPLQKSHSSVTSSAETLKMYQLGKSVKEIARLRGIKEATVMEHLLPYITSGHLNVLKFVSKEKFRQISDLIEQHGQSLKLIKEHADGCTYDEIKAVVNYRNRPQILK